MNAFIKFCYYQWVKKLLILCFAFSMMLLLYGCRGGESLPFASSTRMNTPLPAQPSRIALLVPLSGPLASSGQAVRNGFSAAYYQDKAHQARVPSVLVLDTNSSNIISLYQQAVHEGARVVVGPLTKEEVMRLAQWNHLSVPTLALNSIGVGPIRNLFQFGLSPVDEAQQAALRAWTDGYRRAAVLAPDNAWGHANASTFIQQFQQYGGNVASQAYYSDVASLDPSIRQLLGVNAATINNNKVASRFKRRQDIDMIFLIAPSGFARQIKPLLNYYYAGNLPIYATSHVYQGTPNPSLDTDLNGIQFCDMPWIITPLHLVPASLTSVRSKIANVWPDAFATQPRLFALGVDAYNLIGQLNSMQTSSRYIVDAATGMLYLNSQQRVVRQLYCARFDQGVPVPLQ